MGRARFRCPALSSASQIHRLACVNRRSDIARKLCECMQISASFHTIATTKPVSSSTESVTMAIMKFPVRRLIIAGGFAAAMAAAPAVAVVAMPAPDAAPLAQCAGGEEEDLYTGICVPHTVPNSGAPYQAARRAAFGGRARRRRREHSVHRPQLRRVHRPCRRGPVRSAGRGAGVERRQQPDGNRVRRQRRVGAASRPGPPWSHIWWCHGCKI